MRFFPKVKLSACPLEIQNFGNSTAGISIPGQFCAYLEFRGEKYLNTFIVTDANDCPNLLSHGAMFRMGVLLPNYTQDMVVQGANVPHFRKMRDDTAGPNVFQILKDKQTRKQQTKIPIGTNGKRSFQFLVQMPYQFQTQFESGACFFQDHHTLHIHRQEHIKKYCMEWIPSTLCACPQVYNSCL